MSKITSAAIAVTLLISAAIVSNSCAWNSNAPAVQFSQSDLQALHSTAPETSVGVIALTHPFEAATFAKMVERLGGDVRIASEKAGVVVADLTAAEAISLSEMPMALALANQISVAKQIEFDFSQERLDPETGLEHDPNAVVIDKRPENSQLPTHEMGVLDFERDMKTRFGVDVNGETVKIAVVDTGLDLAHTDVFQDRLRVSWDMTKEGRIKVAPAKFDDVTSTISTNGANPSAPKLTVPVAMHSPTKDYFLGKVRESEYKNADFNQNGSVSDEFDLLLSKTSGGWRVSVDADKNKDFSNDKSIGDFESTHEWLAMDRSRSGLVRINVNLPVRQNGTIVTADDGSVEVNVAGYDAGQHGTHVAGIAAGRFDGPQFGGAFRGGAPKATLFGVKVLAKNGGSDADIIAGIALAVDKGADIINMSLGSGRRPTDGLDSLSKAIDQVAKRTNTLFVISAGNAGPTMGSIGTPSVASHALSIGASVTGATWRGDYNIPHALDGQFMWYFSSRGPQDTGEIRPSLVAPGSAYSSIPLARINGGASGYTVMQGTSMAAPAATGAIASLIDAVRKLKGQKDLASDALNLRWALTEGAIDMNTLNTSTPGAPHVERYEQGAGLLNLPGAFAALEKRGLGKAIEYDVRTTSLRSTYTESAHGVYATQRLPDTISFTVRKVAADPIDPTEHNFDRDFDVTSDTTWVTVQNPKIVLNGLNDTSVGLAIDQAALANLPFGIHMARVTGRHEGVTEWVFDITYVKARELNETFNRGEFQRTDLYLMPGALERYFFYVGTERTRIRASVRVPVLDASGNYSDGRYRMTISDPLGRRVLESEYATGKNPLLQFQQLDPISGVWEVTIFRSYGTKDDGTKAMVRFNTESLSITPSTWDEILPAGKTTLTKSFTLVGGGRAVAPIGFVQVRSVGSVVPDVVLTAKTKSEVALTVPKGARDIVIRTHQVKGIRGADVDLSLLMNGKEIATSGGPEAEETIRANVPGGTALTLVIEAFDLLDQPTGKIDVEVDFTLPAILTGPTTLTGQALPRGVTTSMTATVDLAGLGTGVVDEVRTQFKTVVLSGEVELFDSVQSPDTKVGSIPLRFAMP